MPSNRRDSSNTLESTSDSGIRTSLDGIPASLKPQQLANNNSKIASKEPHSSASSIHNGRLPPRGELSRGSSSTSIMLASLSSAQLPAKAGKINLPAQTSRRSGGYGFQKQFPLTSGNGNLDDINGHRKNVDFPYLVSDKKRLVQQFYDNVNDGSMSKNSSAKDLSNMFTSRNPASSYDTPSSSAGSRDLEPPDLNFFTRDVIASGGFGSLATEAPLQNDIVEALDYLLNIDTVLQNKSTHNQSTDFLSLGNFLDSLNASLMNSTSMHTPPDGPSRPSEALGRLSHFLASVSSHTDRLVQEIAGVADSVRSAKKDEISVDLCRIDSLAGHLSSLEEKLASLKATINTDKHVMSNVILQKIEVLDNVNQKYQEHAKMTRDRQLKHFYTLLSFIVVVVSIYLIHR